MEQNNNNNNEMDIDYNENKCQVIDIISNKIELDHSKVDKINNETKIIIPDQLTQKKGIKVFGFYLNELKWFNIIFLIALHLLAIYGYIHGVLYHVKFFTVVFVSIISIFSGLGMSVGGHRLWAHKSFKARLPLRVFLLILQTATCNGSALSYARDHRTHHKWTDQEQDPKNPSKGFFYAHIGWWLLKKKQIVKDYGNKLNFDDLYNDPLLKFQHQFYYPLALVFGFILPTLIPYYFWTESPLQAFLLCGCLRTCVILHHLYTVNSLAHYVGWRPYDKYMLPTENRLVIYLSLGEGNHNYHHTFPWDYSSSERRAWEFYNPSTAFIWFNSLIGLAYDLKKPSKELVHKVVNRKGIPEYFERFHNQGVVKRLLLGIMDWAVGIIVSLWPVFTIIIFKTITGQDMLVIHHSFKPYFDWLKHLSSADNFVIYY